MNIRDDELIITDNGNSQKKTVLIVDDSRISRIMLVNSFMKDYTVDTADGGAEALAKLHENSGYSAVVLDLMMPGVNGFDIMADMRNDAALSLIPIIVVTASTDDATQIKAFDAGAWDVILRPYSAAILLHRTKVLIERNEYVAYAKESRILNRLITQSEIDEKTGISNKSTFCRQTSRILKENPDKRYVIVRWDIDNFKTYNEIFGTGMGDKFLARVGEEYRRKTDDSAVSCCHIEADHFAACFEQHDFIEKNIVGMLEEFLNSFGEDFDFVPRVGIYEVGNPSADVSLMLDRALVALKTIKGDRLHHSVWFENIMLKSRLEEQKVISEMNKALEERRFVPYFQPQFNCMDESVCGTEMLVRWNHPARGIIQSRDFISVFEKCGFICKMDEYIWEEACRTIRRWIDSRITVVPVSVNVSRADIYNPRLCEILDGLINKYGLEARLLQLEITEAAYIENPDKLIRVIERLRIRGFEVVLDNFGSGYSSLKILSDVSVSAVKLDMKSVESGEKDSRSGKIFSSVIHMAKQLKLRVLASSVENKNQVDYLKSIGCVNMQGYFFARPMSSADFEKLLSDKKAETPAAKKTYSPDSFGGKADFLDESTQAALMFNSLIGGAQIIEYDGKNAKSLRINDRFYDVIGCSPKEYSGEISDTMDKFTAESRDRLKKALDEARRTGGETECELELFPLGKGKSRVWTANRIRFLTQKGSSGIFYLCIENITEKRELDITRRKLEAELAMKARQMEAMLANAPGGVEVFAVYDGKITREYISAGVVKLFGCKDMNELNRLLRNNVFARIHPNDRQRIEKAAEECIRNKTPFAERYRIIIHDNVIVWISLRGNPVIGADGIWRYYCIYTNITELMEIEEKLQNERQKTNFAIQNANIHLWEYNIAAGTFKKHGSFNNSLLPDILEGVPESPIENEYVNEISAADYIELHEAVKRGEKSVSRDILLLTSSEKYEWRRIQYSTIFRDGKPIGAIGCAVNISAEAEMMKMKRELDTLLENSSGYFWTLSVKTRTFPLVSGKATGLGIGIYVNERQQGLAESRCITPEGKQCIYDVLYKNGEICPQHDKGTLLVSMNKQLCGMSVMKLVYSVVRDKNGLPSSVIFIGEDYSKSEQ